MTSAIWGCYRNFSKSEFDCKETGENNMQHEFMDKLQLLRLIFDKPMPISSGYRSPHHSIEKNKKKAGSHTTGMACDVIVSGKDAFELVSLAIEFGFKGIGVSQKGSNRFIHLDVADGNKFSRPLIWSY